MAHETTPEPVDPGNSSADELQRAAELLLKAAGEMHKEAPQAFMVEDLSEVQALLGDIGTAVKTSQKLVNDYLVTIDDAQTLDAHKRFILLLSAHVSVQALPGYATLDLNHIIEIHKSITTIAEYAADPSRKRPLNLLMLASPGSGKSHLVDCIAKCSELSDRRIGVVGCNMANLRSHEDMVGALDAARNLKIEDRIPLLFLDEFDSSDSNYALLLPLLWDGAFTVGQRKLSLGKTVMVLAGSSSDLPRRMNEAKRMTGKTAEEAPRTTKIEDLLSRINGGVLTIPPHLDLAQRVDRRADKVMISIHLLRKRFGSQLRFVARGWLQFIANVEFSYDVRSIEHLIELIPYVEGPERLTLANIDGIAAKERQLLRSSSLAYHVSHRDGPTGIEELWRQTVNGKNGADLVQVFDDRLIAVFKNKGSIESKATLKSVFDDLRRD